MTGVPSDQQPFCWLTTKRCCPLSWGPASDSLARRYRPDESFDLVFQPGMPTGVCSPNGVSTGTLQSRDPLHFKDAPQDVPSGFVLPISLKAPPVLGPEWGLPTWSETGPIWGMCDRRNNP
jgi:hypothetical protein